MAAARRRLDALEEAALEAELERRMELEVEAMVDALERELDPATFRRVLDVLARLDSRVKPSGW
jgi:hypothetical protein